MEDFRWWQRSHGIVQRVSDAVSAVGSGGNPAAGFESMAELVQLFQWVARVLKDGGSFDVETGAV